MWFEVRPSPISVEVSSFLSPSSLPTIIPLLSLILNLQYLIHSFIVTGDKKLASRLSNPPPHQRSGRLSSPFSPPRVLLQPFSRSRSCHLTPHERTRFV